MQCCNATKHDAPKLSQDRLDWCHFGAQAVQNPLAWTVEFYEHSTHFFGDHISIDARTGALHVHVSEAELAARPSSICTESGHQTGLGREYFQLFRDHVSGTETGCSILFGEKP